VLHIKMSYILCNIGNILYSRIYDKNTIFCFIVMVILLHHSLVRANCIIFSYRYIDKKKNEHTTRTILYRTIVVKQDAFRYPFTVHGWPIPMRSQKFGEYNILTIYMCVCVYIMVLQRILSCVLSA